MSDQKETIATNILKKKWNILDDILNVLGFGNVCDFSNLFINIIHMSFYSRKREDTKQNGGINLFN